MTRSETAHAFLAAVLCEGSFKAFEARFGTYTFVLSSDGDVWECIREAARFRFVGDNAVLAVATYLRQRYFDAKPLVRALLAFEACPTGTTAESVAASLLPGRGAQHEGQPEVGAFAVERAVEVPDACAVSILGE